MTSDAAASIHTLGYVPLDCLPSLYHFSKAVVVPSIYEGFGLPALEGLCCSAIVLTSRTSSLPDVVGDAGRQFDPFDPDDIANAMRWALELGPAEALRVRRRARERGMMLAARSSAEAIIAMRYMMGSLDHQSGTGRLRTSDRGEPMRQTAP
jgi:glycosyltransferase involved in cell wall biosynthesis